MMSYVKISVILMPHRSFIGFFLMGSGKGFVHNFNMISGSFYNSFLHTLN